MPPTSRVTFDLSTGLSLRALRILRRPRTGRVVPGIARHHWKTPQRVAGRIAR